MRNSSWEESLLKKYGTTSHLKLISQLRSEIKNYPIKRTENKPNINTTNKSDKQIQSEKLVKKELNPQELILKSETIYSNVNDFKPNKTLNTEDTKSNIEEDTTHTFKDRLKNIDMR